jgi:hypothetical protein
MKYSINENLKNEINDLKNRARQIGYKNVFPKFPKEQYSQKSFDNLMMGFEKRLTNWKNGLEQLENPGGALNGKKREQIDKTSEGKIDLRHFITNSFDGLEKLTEK